jgi:hypothetical protein
LECRVHGGRRLVYCQGGKLLVGWGIEVRTGSGGSAAAAGGEHADRLRERADLALEDLDDVAE